MKRTVVLISRENFVWSSMQEIIPSLEQAWFASAQENAHEIKVIDVDEIPLGQALPALMQTDTVVLTCFTHKLTRTAVLLRERFGIEARFVIHLHNQATIACWPYHAWGLGKWLRTDDTFISTCSFDAEALRKSFKEPRVEVVPFTFSEKDPFVPGNQEGREDFVYVGRLSAQKNLHTLIYAFALFLKQNDANLVFYGGEDNLGSPSMGMKSQGYAAELRNLAETLGIAQKVIFKGQTPRQQLVEELRQRHIFVSPSLHADENFGMAAFRSLAAGRKAVLSRWGGHADFAEYFPKQVFLADVWSGGSGPWIDPRALANAMTQAMNSPELPSRPLPERYRSEYISARLRQIATQNLQKGGRLEPSEVARSILTKRESYAATEPSRIFNSYADPDTHPFFAAYGMKFVELKPQKDLQLHPWVKIENGELVANDPHRGMRRWSIDAAGDFEVRDIYGASSTIGSDLAKSLLCEGFAN